MGKIKCPEWKSTNVVEGIIWYDIVKSKNIKVEMTVDTAVAVAMHRDINPAFGEWCKSCDNFFYLEDE